MCRCGSDRRPESRSLRAREKRDLATEAGSAAGETTAGPVAASTAASCRCHRGPLAEPRVLRRRDRCAGAARRPVAAARAPRPHWRPRGREVRVRRLGPAARVGERVTELDTKPWPHRRVRGPELQGELVEPRRAVEGQRLGGLRRRVGGVDRGPLLRPAALVVDRQGLWIGNAGALEREGEPLVRALAVLRREARDDRLADPVVVDLDLLVGLRLRHRESSARPAAPRAPAGRPPRCPRPGARPPRSIGWPATAMVSSSRRASSGRRDARAQITSSRCTGPTAALGLRLCAPRPRERVARARR